LNEWVYAHPGHWGVAAGSAWAVMWICTELIIGEAFRAALIGGSVGGLGFGFVTYAVTRWRRNRRLSPSTRPSARLWPGGRGHYRNAGGPS